MPEYVLDVEPIVVVLQYNSVAVSHDKGWIVASPVRVVSESDIPAFSDQGMSRLNDIMVVGNAVRVRFYGSANTIIGVGTTNDEAWKDHDDQWMSING